MKFRNFYFVNLATPFIGDRGVREKSVPVSLSDNTKADKELAYRFEVGEFLLVADRLAELDKYDEACQVLTTFASHFAETPEIQQKPDTYCE